MKLTLVILGAIIGQVSAADDATMTQVWKKANSFVEFEFGGGGAVVAKDAKFTVVLPTGYFCKPKAAIAKENILKATGGTAATIVANAKDVAVTGGQCSDDGTSFDITVGAATEAGAVKFFLQKTVIIPNSNTLLDATGLKLGASGMKASEKTGLNGDTAFGATFVDGGKLTLSSTVFGTTGTMKWEGTFKATPFDAATDKICMWFPGYTIPDKAKCKFFAEGKTGKEQTISGDQADSFCQLAEDTATMLPIKDKKYFIECDKFKAPAAVQKELAFGVGFDDQGTGKCISASFHKLPAATTAAPTRSPTRAPTRAFSAAPAVSCGVGFFSAAVAYFLL